jgi:hypothetical protein
MFFRRKNPHQLTFDERLNTLKQNGFSVSSEGGKTRVSKLGCAAIVEGSGVEVPKVGKAGVVVGNEIGYLVSGGYQSFFETPGGRRVAALAEHLKALHTFDEDLREALGLTSYYNTSLGTTFDRHVYDRVQDRDVKRTKKPWEANVREGKPIAK